MSAGFDDLIAPLSESEFFDLLRQRRVQLLRPSDATARRGLLTWETLGAAITNGTFPPKRLRVRNERTVMDRFFYQNGDVPSLAKLTRLMSSGMSVIAVPIDEHVPAVDALRRDIQRRTTDRVWTGAIATAGTGGALRLHFDSQDLLILQLEGTKRWKIFGPPVEYPYVGVPNPPPPDGEPLFDETLTEGDCLFVPSGFWHRCENGPGRSLHLGFFFEAFAGAHVLRALTRRLIEQERFRRPLDRMPRGEDRISTQQAIVSALLEEIQAVSIADLLDRHATAATSGPNA